MFHQSVIAADNYQVARVAQIEMLLTSGVLKKRSGAFELEDVRSLQLSGLGLGPALGPPTSALFECTNLMRLDLSRNDLRDLEGIGALPQLEWLDASDNKISILSPLARLTSLHTLLLANNAIVDMRQLEHLRPLSACLRSITLAPGRGNTITAGDKHVGVLMEVIPSLIALDGRGVELLQVRPFPGRCESASHHCGQ